ncbi:MAG TPA: bifunctional pyr operon transcriptional regulator/uracil phosphoribosyltransferase PyrR [Methylophilaceae bacterium]|nr:bifunctional pyr operon transcriptional regulator/uracil phosphoribosyltransferase PyrR [Methylophilaceae bacterium]
MQLPDPETLLTEITAKIKNSISDNSALVGIHSGGVWIMESVLANLDNAIPFGTLDASLYRDDYAQRGLKRSTQPANITFDVQNKDIILIDDIFYTGRTTRAAINELFDYGRPASITLAVLINRGGAELPIAPQIVGATIPIIPSQNFKLSRSENGTLALALENTQDANYV